MKGQVLACSRRWRTGAIVALVAAAGLVLTTGRAVAQDGAPPPLPAEEQPEALTSGPVNEAFAAPVNLQGQDGVVAPHAPPAPIVEYPTADKPAGDQFTWVPGYWSWAAERNTYVWASGCWRAVPPHMVWVPGYWCQVSSGWQWVPGFWAPAENPQVEYLPPPPPAEEIEPPGPPPYADVAWVPGCWYWQQNQYVRRHGYWVRQQRGWMWSPSHCLWTPRGYVFVRGYWDFELERRGMLFAPAYIPPVRYRDSSFCFTPSITIDLACLQVNLFVYPRYTHYYVGDYYDASYRRGGIYPRCDSDTSHTWYDPIYVHERWNHHADRDSWQRRQRQEYEQRRDCADLRPARTYREQESRVARLPEGQRRALQVGRPLQRVVANPSTPLRFERVSVDAQRTIARRTEAARNDRDDRRRRETAPVTARPTTPIPDRTPRHATTNQPGADRTPRPATPAPDRTPRPVTPNRPGADRTPRPATPTPDRTLRPTAPIPDRTPRSATPTPDRTLRPTAPIPDRTPRHATPTPDRTLRPTAPIPDRTPRHATPGERGRTGRPAADPRASSVPPPSVRRTDAERVRSAPPPLAARPQATPGTPPPPRTTAPSGGHRGGTHPRNTKGRGNRDGD